MSDFSQLQNLDARTHCFRFVPGRADHTLLANLVYSPIASSVMPMRRKSMKPSIGTTYLQSATSMISSGTASQVSAGSRGTVPKSRWIADQEKGSSAEAFRTMRYMSIGTAIAMSELARHSNRMNWPVSRPLFELLSKVRNSRRLETK